MRRSRLVVAVVVALVSVGVALPPASAVTAMSLVLPQGTAFGFLGHSCGGIQEQVFATGFDAASGYPTGDVRLQTRCGGSGRGGGYHTTTYTAWAGATWDFTGAVVSTAVLAAAPTNLDPAFTAFDASGNELYNLSNSAFLSLSPAFVPAPRVTGLSSTLGPADGGTNVTLTGTGFTGATEVDFGAMPATFTVINDTSIAAVSPATAAGTVDVTVSSAGGPSATSTADEFTFVAAPSVSGLTPDAGPIFGGTTVTISGANFTGATAVLFGDTAAGFTVDDDGSITAVAPPAEAPDTVAVTVTTIGGTSAASPADQFSYVVEPSAPPAVSATAGDGAASVKWSAPATNGLPLTGYVVTPYVAGVAQAPITFTSTATTETIGALTNGTAYTFKVAATNDSTTGPLSAASSAVTAGAPLPPTTPRARSGATVATTGPVSVSFVAGANNGAAITSYTATCRSTNGVTGSKTGSTSPLIVGALTTGRSYTCTVKATNARGTGSSSGASAAVVVGSPAPPISVVGTHVAAGQVRVAFTLGAGNGSAITSQTATCTSSNGGATHSATHAGATAAPITVIALTVGKSYTCTVRATNARGVGVSSAPSPTVGT